MLARFRPTQNRSRRRVHAAPRPARHSRAPEAEGLPGRTLARRSSGADAIGISVWDLKENAESYGRGAYAEVLKVLEPLFEGTPQVQTYEVTNSTFHKIPVRAIV